MKLNEQGLKEKRKWLDKGYQIPEFDRREMIQRTKENPKWIHFGAGNIFRAYHANIAQKLLNKGIMDTGIIVAEGFDYEIIEKMYRPHDEYSILVTLKSDGNIEKTVIGSVAESCILDAENEIEFGRLKEIFANRSLQFATFTITEKGYSLTDAKGKTLKAVEEDFAAGPVKPRSYIGKVASLLYGRYKAGAFPIAMVSMDNCSHNGGKLYKAVDAFAEKWAENRVVEEGFANYMRDGKKVSFPWTMIDKITPRPDNKVKEILQKDNVEDLELVVTGKNTYAAPFVNAEECEYLVVEDDFPAGRPRLEEAGLIFTDKETVNKTEKMKVCTCLNPLHTALAVFGCLLGYERIADEMKDETLKKLVEGIGYTEGLPVVADPKVLNPKEFLDTVLTIRIPNPFMPDTPQRIATDTSQKLPIRYGETIKSYMTSDKLKVKDLKLIPLVFAGWLRYLMGINDSGEKFQLSPDPLIPSVCGYVEDFKLGEEADVEEALRPVLENSSIFGVDLYEAGMAETVCDYFRQMLLGKGAVRAVLEKYI